MNRISGYLLIVLLLSLMSFSIKTDLAIARLTKIEEHLYNGSTIYNTNMNFYHSYNRLDSVTSVRTENRYKDWPTKEVYKYKYFSNKVEVYEEGGYYPTPTKIYNYEFDSKGRLSKFLIYGQNKILINELYFYDKKNKSIRVTTTEKYETDTLESVKETVYFLNKSHNIDSTYEYYLNSNNKMGLCHIRIYKYDIFLNPYKTLLFGPISEYYFNSNNVVSCQYLDAYRKTPKSNINKYEYDLKGRIKRQFNDEIYESDSIVQVYHYLDNRTD